MIPGASIVGDGLPGSTIPAVTKLRYGRKAYPAHGAQTSGMPARLPCWLKGVKLHWQPWRISALDDRRIEMNDRMARIILLLLAVAFAISPFFSNGFGGFYRESFPVQVDRWPAQPVGWAFSIWGAIYLGLILAATWALWRPATMPAWGRAIWPLGVSLLIGVFWVETAMRSPLLATIMILVMTTGAIIAMLHTHSNWREWGPLGLYAGWLTAASGVAVSVVATGYGILSSQVAAIALIACVLVVAIAVSAARAHIGTYRAGVIWALFGVIITNLAAGDWLIVTLCSTGIVVLGFFDRFIKTSSHR